VWSSVSSFNFQYHLVFLKSSSSCFRLLPRLSVTFRHPPSFPLITWYSSQFLCQMWPIQLAFHSFVGCIIYLSSLATCNTSFLTRCFHLIFSITTFQNIAGIYWYGIFASFCCEKLALEACPSILDTFCIGMFLIYRSKIVPSTKLLNLTVHSLQPRKQKKQKRLHAAMLLCKQYNTLTSTTLHNVTSSISVHNFRIFFNVASVSPFKASVRVIGLLTARH